MSDQVDLRLERLELNLTGRTGCRQQCQSVLAASTAEIRLSVASTTVVTERKQGMIVHTPDAAVHASGAEDCSIYLGVDSILHKARD